MRKLARKFQKLLFFPIVKVIGSFRPSAATKISVATYTRWGMKFTGSPNYISSQAWFDGTDYSRISIGEGVTISSQVSILTHDWALHTIGKSLAHTSETTLGRHGSVTIEDFAFIGRGVLILPNTHIGSGCLIGAGAVVRGNIPAKSIYIGNPGKVVGNTESYFKKYA